MSRLDRLGSVIKREISAIITKKLDTSYGLVSITGVRVSPDLAHCWIRYSLLGAKKKQAQTQKRLDQVKDAIRYDLAKVLHTKVVPDLHFEYDPSLELGSDIINKINKL